MTPERITDVMRPGLVDICLLSHDRDTGQPANKRLSRIKQGTNRETHTLDEPPAVVAFCRP